MLQRMELLLKLTPAEDIQLHVLPMLYRGLDCDSPQIHELCLAVLPTFASLLDHSNVKNSLLPRIKRLCLSTSTLSVRVNCLLCIGKLLEHLDKWLVLDEILPFLPQIPSREPAVLMGIIGIYKMAMNHKKLGITKEIIASRVLPFLIPLCIENGLTLAQFNALTSLVKEMFQVVENEHRTKLEQLNSVKDEEKTLASNMTDITNPSIPEKLDQPVSSFMSHSLSPKEKQSENVFSNTTVESVKLSDTPKAETKDLSKSLLDDWVSSVKTSESTSKTSTAGFPTHSYVAGENKTSLPNNNLNANNWNKEIGSQSSISQNPWNSSMGNSSTNNYNLNPPNYNLSPMMTYNNQQMSNPWTSNQQRPAFNHSNNQNWSALDNLLPSNSNSSKLPMNQMIQSNRPLMSPPSPNNNRSNNQLSKDDIMDLLS